MFSRVLLGVTVRREKALDFSGCNSRPGTGSLHPVAIEAAEATKLSELSQDRLFVCTQNVDNLHEQAGSRNVAHMHGELFKSRCDTCNRAPFGDTNLYEPPAEIPC